MSDKEKPKNTKYELQEKDVLISPDGRVFLNLKISPKKTITVEITEVITVAVQAHVENSFKQGKLAGIHEANQNKKKNESN